MATLLISATPDLEDAFSVRDLPLRFEYFTPEPAGENCRVHGEVADLEAYLWRYVTPTEAVERGEWLTPESASASDKEDFEHFNDISEDPTASVGEVLHGGNPDTQMTATVINYVGHGLRVRTESGVTVDLHWDEGEEAFTSEDGYWDFNRQ